MNKYIEEFSNYLTEVKKASTNTSLSYIRDLNQFDAYLSENDLGGILEISKSNIDDYVAHLQQLGKSDSTVMRATASLKSFYNFLVQQGYLDQSPVHAEVKRRSEKYVPEILTVEEVDKLLSSPKAKDAKGIRDKAVLELLYATGIRVTELINLNMTDVNTELGFIRCASDGHGRMIPMYPAAAEAVRNYQRTARNMLVTNPAEKALFVNVYGERLTRQGLWKIIKFYTKEAKINKEITPQTLRHSFAVHLLENGADLKSVQEMLGHADISSTQVYVNIVKSKLQSAYTKHPRAN